MNLVKKLLFTCIILSLLLPTYSFAEGPERLTVEILKAGDVISGDASGNVHEDKPLRREELVTMLVRMAENKNQQSFVLPSKSSFKDVPTSHWAFESIEKAKFYNLSTGIGNDLFGLGQEVTYQQALSFITRLVGLEFPWNGVLELAPEYGFSALEPSLGHDFLRGHMFDLTAQAIAYTDPTTNNHWGAEIINALPEVLQKEIKNLYRVPVYIDNDKHTGHQWEPSIHATQEQLEERFNVSDLNWQLVENNALDKVRFSVELPNEFYGEIPWQITYVDHLESLYAFFYGPTFGSDFPITIEDVYTNTTQSVNGQNVTTFLITSHMNIGFGYEPIRIVLQTNETEFVRGWFDAITLTRDLIAPSDSDSIGY